jgi:hypothetical protein
MCLVAEDRKGFIHRRVDSNPSYLLLLISCLLVCPGCTFHHGALVRQTTQRLENRVALHSGRSPHRATAVHMNGEGAKVAASWDHNWIESKGIDVELHAANLQERGFTVISEPILDIALIESARVQSQARLNHLLAQVEAAGCDPLEQQYRFSEIVHRQRHRWDLQLADTTSSGDTTWTQLCSSALSIVKPIIHEAQGPAFAGIKVAWLCVCVCVCVCVCSRARL